MSSTGHATTCDTESDRYAADCRGDASTASCACGSDLWPAPCALECHCRCQRVAYIRHAACERIVMSVLAPQAPRTRLVIVACRWHARCLTSQSTAEAYARFCRGERGAWRRPQVGTAGLGQQFLSATCTGRMAVALCLNGRRADAFVPEARHFHQPGSRSLRSEPGSAPTHFVCVPEVRHSSGQSRGAGFGWFL